MTRAARARAIESQQRWAVISTSSISSGRQSRRRAVHRHHRDEPAVAEVDATIDDAIPTAVNAVVAAELADHVVHDQRAAGPHLARRPLAERRQRPRADERGGERAPRVCSCGMVKRLPSASTSA